MVFLDVRFQVILSTIFEQAEGTFIQEIFMVVFGPLVSIEIGDIRVALLAVITLKWLSFFLRRGLDVGECFQFSTTVVAQLCLGWNKISFRQSCCRGAWLKQRKVCLVLSVCLRGFHEWVTTSGRYVNGGAGFVRFNMCPCIISGNWIGVDISKVRHRG